MRRRRWLVMGAKRRVARRPGSGALGYGGQNHPLTAANGDSAAPISGNGHLYGVDQARIRGFHISALLSSFLRWEELIVEHHEAKKLAEEHDHSKLKTFVTGRWAEPWVVPSIGVKDMNFCLGVNRMRRNCGPA